VLHGTSHGFAKRGQCLWHVFDLFLVVMSTVDVCFTILHSTSDIGKIAIFRIIRILRLTRVVQLLQLKEFKDLILMIRGVLFGLKTLLWAMVLLILFIYSVGVLLRVTLGPEMSFGCKTVSDRCSTSQVYVDKHREELFSSLYRSMFTVYRCLFDGCSAVDGTPLVPYLMNVYGWWVGHCFQLLLCS